MPLVFAYGSNMDRAAMAARCPHSRDVGLARLPRHRVFIMAEGYASLAADPRGIVWGLLWDIALADMPALDRYEGVGQGLYVKVAQAVLTEAGPRRALVYRGRSTEAGLPRPGYVEAVLAAAGEVGLPDEALQNWRRLLPQAVPVRSAPPPVAGGWQWEP